MKKKKRQQKDPDSMSTLGKIAAFILLLLFAAYLIFFGNQPH